MAVEWENGIPILTGESMLSDVPEYTQEMAQYLDGAGGSGGSVDPLDIARAANPIGTVIPYAGDWGEDYANLAARAPYHLPCTGGVYATADCPELSEVLGHTFATFRGPRPSTGGAHPEEGDIAGGEYLTPGTGADADYFPATDADGNPHIAEGVYRYQLTGEPPRPPEEEWLPDPPPPGEWKLIVADGFLVPDLQGRSPVGAGGEGVAREWTLGERWGDRRPGLHGHDITSEPSLSERIGRQNNQSNAGGISRNVENTALRGRTAFPFFATPYSNSEWWKKDQRELTADGLGRNYHPGTGVNWLIFTGQVVASPVPIPTGLRDGSVHRVPAVTIERAIRQRLAEPDLPDEEREYLEARLKLKGQTLEAESQGEAEGV